MKKNSAQSPARLTKSFKKQFESLLQNKALLLVALIFISLLSFSVLMLEGQSVLTWSGVRFFQLLLSFVWLFFLSQFFVSFSTKSKIILGVIFLLYCLWTASIKSNFFQVYWYEPLLFVGTFVVLLPFIVPMNIIFLVINPQTMLDLYREICWGRK